MAPPDPRPDGAPEGVLARLFAGLSRLDLAKLSAHLEPLDAQPGEEVFRQGETGDSLYVVASGRFGVFVRAADGAGETRVGDCREGDLFGEMALFTDEPRSATVRAEEAGRLLKLPRERFHDLLGQAPDLAVAIAATLSRRLRSANQARARGEAFIRKRLDEALDALPAARRAAVLTASLLDAPAAEALAPLVGPDAPAVAADLARLGAEGEAGAAVVLPALRARLAAEAGAGGVAARAAEAAHRLVAARAWEDALRVLARHGTPEALGAALGAALRASPPPPVERLAAFLDRIGDDAGLDDLELVLARVARQEERGDRERALRLARRALGAALDAPDQTAARRLSAEVTRLSGGGRRAAARAGVGLQLHEAVTRLPRGAAAATACAGASAVCLALAAWPGAAPPRQFVCLLLAGIALMLSRLVPDFAVGLGLVAGWVLLGLAKPAQALAGFATKEWLFVVTVYGLASAAARSGVLFRIGLLLVRRLPHGLFWQAGTLLAAGLALTPLVPSSTGRVSLTQPLALAMAEALHLPERGRTAALLGLAAWVGAGPLMFLFLNGSSTCLLAWGLLPDASRARFTWGYWLLATLPLGLVVCAGSIGLLLALLRPGPVARPSSERVTLQVAVLGPPAPRELATLAVLALTVAGWVLAPLVGLDLATVALLGLLAAVAIGSFDARAFQALDWSVIVFFGVVLTIGRLAASLELDRAAASAILGVMGSVQPGPLVLVLAVAGLSILARLVLEQDLTVLLASLTLLPVASRVGLEPWVVMIAVLATSVAWIVPTQTQAFLVGLSASEGRLFSVGQAQRFALLYTALVLAGLALSVPYWRLLGLL